MIVPCDFDGSGCYRLFFPAEALRRQLGWEVAMPEYTASQLDWVDGGIVDTGMKRVRFDDLHAKILAIRPDAVVFQRPVQVGVPELIDDLRARGIAVVIETDDLMDGLPSWNPAFARLDVKFSPFRNNMVFAECARRADLVTCSTPFLADKYAQLGPPTVVLRNRLHWPMWDGVPVFEDAGRDWSRVRVGWMGNAMWHTADLDVLRGIIVPWLERNPGVDFVAQPAALEHMGIPENRRVVMGEVAFRDLTLRSITAIMDIGLVPLAVHDFNEGKSHLKGLEYAACGIPCIASPTESYRWWVEPGVNGLLARKPRHWVAALDRMVGDMEATRRMGRAAYEKARTQAVDLHVEGWADAYRLAGSLAARGTVVSSVA